MNILFGNKKNIVLIGALLISLLLLYIDKAYGIGFLIGVIISLINMVLIEIYSHQILSQREYRSFPGFLFYLFRSLLLVIPFILTVIWPEFVNIFASVMGILYFKIILFGTVFIRRRED